MVVAWHGSPHDHNRFDSSKIGTGENGASFGHGHYFTEKKEIAEWYKENLAIKKIAIRNRVLKHQTGHLANALRVILRTVANGEASFSDARDRQIARLTLGQVPSEMRDAKGLRGLNEDDVKEIYESHLYEVELAPDEDEFIDWDNEMFDMEGTPVSDLMYDALLDSGAFTNADRLTEVFSEMTGAQAYKKIAKALGSQQAASEYLRSLGIRGIRYLDGSSRSKGEGSSNYVVFDDKDIAIKAKHGRKSVDIAQADNGDDMDDDDYGPRP